MSGPASMPIIRKSSREGVPSLLPTFETITPAKTSTDTKRRRFSDRILTENMESGVIVP